MIWGASPVALAARFTALAQAMVADGPAERLDRARRQLLQAVAALQPATLNQVASAIGRGAPAVSRSVDSLVRARLIDRSPDPANRRRLALTLTDAGRTELANPPAGSARLETRLERLAQSELRAIERAFEILER